MGTNKTVKFVDDYAEVTLRMKTGTHKILMDPADLHVLDEWSTWAVASQSGYLLGIKNDSGGIVWSETLHKILIGPTVKGFEIDHINQNRLDNRRRNLRVVTKSTNLHNGIKYKSYAKKNCSSKYRGVTWDKSVRDWKVQFRHKVLGLYIQKHFKDEKDAAKFYDYLRKKHLNFPPVNFPEVS